MSVTVRMFNVGFGDCFLVLINDGPSTTRILFDCGSFNKDGAHMERIARKVIEQCTDSDGVPRIDLVVCTHRHKDHVSGFNNAFWNSVEVKEVWMPWTEHPTDPEAKRIREKQARLALAAERLLNSPTASSLSGQIRSVVELNALTNEKAMRTVHTGFKGSPKRRFLPLRNETELTRTYSVAPKCRISILGPPHNADVIRDMNPPEGKAFLNSGGFESGNSCFEPFGRSWRVRSSPSGSVDKEERAKIQAFNVDSVAAIMTSLDKAVNGTSLVVIIQVENTTLLFPGDAQWGTWKAMLSNSEARELLKNVSFYKVGHHCSHNATPREFVEDLLQKDAFVMASLAAIPQWPDIPRQQLLTALNKKTRFIARSDSPEAPFPFKNRDDFLELTLDT